jgi:2-amino-4-hydroxy-6-hydroxymethyldihydropteridine diphosphokinase
VDILLFGNEHVDRSDLRIPHPRIAERPFVIEGLEELGAGGAITPGIALRKS